MNDNDIGPLWQRKVCARASTGVAWWSLGCFCLVGFITAGLAISSTAHGLGVWDWLSLVVGIVVGLAGFLYCDDRHYKATNAEMQRRGWLPGSAHGGK